MKGKTIDYIITTKQLDHESKYSVSMNFCLDSRRLECTELEDL